jgi:chromosomal replication initiation ATPase DnaA
MQIPLPLPHRAAMDEADFMITASNQEAAAWINRWPDWPAHCLILYGPAGSGKTHLAHMWARKSGVESSPPVSSTGQALEGEEAKAWTYLSKAKSKSLAFAGEGASSNIIGSSTPSPANSKDLAEAKSKNSLPLPQEPAPCLTRGERTPHPTFALDNADQISGDKENEESLFHLFNRTRDEKGFLLLTGSAPPALWNIQLPDLRSRLLASQAVAIQFPDDALLGALLLKQFSDRQITIDEHVVNYVLSRLERSASAVRDVVEKLDHASLAAGRKITVALARDVLGVL